MKTTNPQLALTAILTVCLSPSGRPATGPDGQSQFATPELAAQALISAAQADDMAALRRIFGRAGKEILDSGDAVQDKNARAAFVAKAQESMKFEKQDPDQTILLIGRDEFPFPVPLVTSNGKWRFDTEEGKHLVLARRIGSNEMEALEACTAFVGAQLQYASEDHNGDGVREYAHKLISSPGKQDGLYPPSGDEPPTALTDLVEQALKEGYQPGKPVAYHGYYYRMLAEQGRHASGGVREYSVHGLMIGGFGLMAWPIEYGVSGVKTFMVNQDGVIYEKDLGQRTLVAVRGLTSFDPDSTWTPLH